MSLDVGVGSVSYPQTGENRTRNRLVSQLCQYIGGASNSDDKIRAAYSIDEAVRHFNKICWRFNRLTESITLSASTSAYTLTATNVKAPMRAIVVDSNSKDIQRVGYVPWQTIMDYDPSTIGTSTVPTLYTLKNLHETGQVTFHPPLGATLTYPTVRLEYFRRIAIEAGNDDVLEVPVEVEQAIFEWALWRLMLKTDVKSSGPFKAAADEEFYQVSSEWRDWPDIPVIGVRG